LIDRLSDADFTRFSELSAQDRSDAAAICRRLDGIPLALELAAGRARDVSLSALAEGLIERFDLLSRGRRTATPRQQTLRGMIDWSFVLLSAAEQRLFCRIGLFAEGFTAEAAAEVSGAALSDVREALRALVAKSLVRVVFSGGVARYRLLETMRAYAWARLRESGELDEYAHRFARYYCSIAKSTDARYGRMPNRDFLALVEPELDNFRAALDWALGERRDTHLGAELAGSLGWTYRQTSLFAEGTRWSERALDENAGRLDGPVAGRLHMALSFFHFNTGQMQRALENAEHAAEAYPAPDAGNRSWAFTQQSYCLYLLGRHEETRVCASEAVRLARTQDDPLRLATALNALALTIPSDRAEERIAVLEEAIAAYRMAGDDSAIVPTANLAETHYANGNPAAALAHGLDVVAMTRKNLDRSNLSAALTNVAAYALTVGDDVQAEKAAREALSLVRDLGRTMNAMCALQHLGTVLARRGDSVAAARLLGAANHLYGDFGLEREFTEQSLYNETLAYLRVSLSEDVCKRHLAEGARLTLDAALDEASKSLVSERNPRSSTITSDDSLTEFRTATSQR
jgi:tetratricopeptide (TPR) repeat protein